jgi:Tfp pilus assembly protein PilV
MKLTAQISPSSARRGVRRSVRALTILEVMIATMVMVLTITSSLQVLGCGLRAIDTARYTTLAGQILQSQMEKLRLLTWTQMTLATGPMASANSTFTPDNGISSQVNNFFTIAPGTTTHTPDSCTQSIVYDPAYDITTSGTTVHTMVDITLTATWIGADGIQRTRTYYSQYAHFGISDMFYTAH